MGGVESVTCHEHACVCWLAVVVWPRTRCTFCTTSPFRGQEEGEEEDEEEENDSG